MKKLIPWLICGSIFCFQSPLLAQDSEIDSLTLKKRKTTVIVGFSTVYVGGMAALYSSWYADYNVGKFHTFNDNNEWLGMDKLGHGFSTYHLGRVSADAFRWAGMNENTAIYLGGSAGLIMLTGVEIFDGFSDGWGFSWGDMIANTAGAALYISQEKLFKEQIVMPKFFYYPSPYAQLNPNLLGSSWNERILKDYNAQSYWLSVNMKSIFQASKIPGWLNLSLGYGATGMVGASVNPPEYSSIDRSQIYYLSLDVNLQKIPTKSPFLRNVFSVFNMFKIPFPAVYVKNGNFGATWLGGVNDI